MPLSKIERVERRRAKLCAAGLLPIQVWVPDTRTSGFAEDCRRQSDLIRSHLVEVVPPQFTPAAAAPATADGEWGTRALHAMMAA